MDMISDEPKILTTFGGTQIMRIDLPGNKPEIIGALGNVKEDTSLLLVKEFSSPKAQKPKKGGDFFCPNQ